MTKFENRHFMVSSSVDFSSKTGWLLAYFIWPGLKLTKELSYSRLKIFTYITPSNNFVTMQCQIRQKIDLNVLRFTFLNGTNINMFKIKLFSFSQFTALKTL